MTINGYWFSKCLYILEEGLNSRFSLRMHKLAEKLFTLVIHYHRNQQNLVMTMMGDVKHAPILWREFGEAITIFWIYLIIYWSKKSMFDWTTGLIVYVGASLCLLFVMEKILRRRNLSVVGCKLPTNRKALLIFTGLLAFYLLGGIIGHITLNIEFPYLNIYFFSGVILGPLVEEIVFRGLIQTRFEAELGSAKPWILSSLLFGFYHFLAWFLIGGKMLTTYSLGQLTYVTVFGILLGILRAKTRSLLPPFLLHAVNNFVAFYT